MHLAIGNSKLVNCTNNVDVSAAGFGVGGVVGKCFGTLEIINCINTASISDTSKNAESVAGIIGRNEANTKVFNSYNLGDIQASGQMAGGVIGQSTTNITIINVYNKGNVPIWGGFGRGGILGSLRGGSTTEVIIKNAYNYGTINGAGICGYIEDQDTLSIENANYIGCSKGVTGKEDSDYGINQLENIDDREVIEKFNSYIDNDIDNINTTTWKKWILGENSTPTFK